jgi:hypothetical protein
MKVSSFVCETLGRLIRPDDGDPKIQYSLRFVWLTVEKALSKGSKVIERLADTNSKLMLSTRERERS